MPEFTLIKRELSGWLIASLSLGGLACSGEETSRVGGLDPRPEEARSAATVNTLAADPEPRLHVPPGFKVMYFARNLPAARFMALGPDGSVYLSQPWLGQVTRLF